MLGADLNCDSVDLVPAFEGAVDLSNHSHIRAIPSIHQNTDVIWKARGLVTPVVISKHFLPATDF